MISISIIEEIRTIINVEDSFKEQVKKVFVAYDCLSIYEHCLEVAYEAKALANTYGEDANGAFRAGLLHDIGGIVPNENRVSVATQLGIELYEEEYIIPMIIHQKISKVIAKEIFHIENPKLLTAIETHTTLHKQPSTLDHIVFLADKLKWDQTGEPPYVDELRAAMQQSLEQGSFYFVNQLYHSPSLKIVHPWLREAYERLKHMNV
ncbi:bis(5'-nucleosyl)-tetraphosphatase (symmetrical) YqeK [Geomicrobium sp. JCM 19038]|uniref:bis(5'-nucleosyl)-tetraphosphatase (symmetrical) YqeK n=1 Tax=Geomicrobium sp. JCM 19038 TaxID=1460635 RepID=UPI00045F273A|nr:bis(5'-nucleosyl)-tetraphosphatase (symmetrical) YqeK [Geomicrobium sp. JCM 19038]GAK09444.1 hydrolase [Geomicrobium sp. JCM 19038]